MTLTNCSIKLCTFCYKSVSRTENKEREKNKELCTKFYKQLSSFVKTSLSSKLLCEIVCCTDCELLINEFCEINHKIKCLELQLQWKLDTLRKVMKLADKVPSRVKILQQSFVETESNKERKKEETDSLDKDHNHHGQSTYLLYRKLRQEILSKCCRGQNITRLQPRVVLKRLNLVDKNRKRTEMNPFSDPKIQEGRTGIDFFIGWLMSFGAVVLLLSFYSDYRNESTPDDDTSSYVYENHDRNILEETVGEEKHRKEIPTTPFYQGNDGDEDQNAEESFQAEVHTDFFVDVPQEPENDSTRTNSEEDTEENLDLKHEPNSENSSKNIIENLNYDTGNSLSFPCQFCSVICTSDSLLESHQQLQHPLFKTKLIRTNYPFSCGLCKRFYKTYGSLKRHKFTPLHRCLDKQRAARHINALANVKSELNFGLLSCPPKSRSNQHEKDRQTSLKTQAVTKKANLKRYNLRSINKKSFISDNGNVNNFNSDSDEDYMQDNESSDTSSSEKSDLDEIDEECLSSNENNKCIEEPIEPNSETPKLYRCLLDNCKLRKTVYHNKYSFDQHKKLHLRGEYKCNFCEKVEHTIIDLSLHETEMHSAIPSTSFSSRNNDNIFYCARCPFETQLEAIYFKHFASAHLGVNVENNNDKIRCDQCFANFKTKSGLSFHKKKIHQEPSKPKLRMYKCTNCDETFEKLLHLEKHLDNEHPDSNISTEFKCAKCNRCFAREKGLKIHMQYIHSGKRSDRLEGNVQFPFFCSLDRCKRRFKDNATLKLHQNLHKRGKYPCKFCDVVMNSILNLSMHESSKHPLKTDKDNRKGLYCCSRCRYKDTSALRYQTHFAQTHFGTIIRPSFAQKEKLLGKYKCNFCEMETSSASELGYHEATHVNKNTKSDNGVKQKIQCSRCPKSFTKMGFIKHFLKNHFPGCTKIKQTDCPICQVKVTRPKIHFKTHHDTKNLENPLNIYKCEGEDDSCKAYFIKYIQLIYHKTRMHQNSNGLTCKECGKKLKSVDSLQNHTRIFHREVLENPDLPFECDEATCKRRFGTTEELEHHKKYPRHKSCLETRIRCEKCDKEFSSEVTLKSHMNSVHAEPSFICQECGKVFRTKSYLVTHSTYHKGPEAWKFKCSTCGKKCVSKYVLTAHMRTHTGEKPYVCQYCGEKYAHSHNWKNHMLTKHKNQDDLPEIRKTASKNRLSRKGTKKGDCVIAEVKQ